MSDPRLRSEGLVSRVRVPGRPPAWIVDDPDGEIRRKKREEGAFVVVANHEQRQGSLADGKEPPR